MELMAQILSDSNIALAQRRVIGNKGASGIDKLRVEELRDYMSSNWMGIKSSILSRNYRPLPVRRIEIPKEQGGVRKLGIPTVVDRTIQQAISQVLTPIFEKEFLPQSYGFRPGRSCKQAIVQLLSNLNECYEWVVDIDLEKFFDNVPQDRLMSLVGRVIQDPGYGILNTEISEGGSNGRWMLRCDRNGYPSRWEPFPLAKQCYASRS